MESDGDSAGPSAGACERDFARKSQGWAGQRGAVGLEGLGEFRHQWPSGCGGGQPEGMCTGGEGREVGDGTGERARPDQGLGCHPVFPPPHT